MLRRPVWAVVPAKAFARGKTRLRTVLADGDRAHFAAALFEHTMTVLVASGLDGVLVATDGDDVATLARAHGARVVRDGSASSLAAVVDAGLAEVEACGARAAVVLMADLPGIEASDVATLLAALESHDVGIVVDHLGRHTNALALRPPTAMRTCFGRADSFAAHCAAARAAGLDIVVVDNERIAFDVDLPADHARLEAAGRP